MQALLPPRNNVEEAMPSRRVEFPTIFVLPNARQLNVRSRLGHPKYSLGANKSSLDHPHYSDGNSTLLENYRTEIHPVAEFCRAMLNSIEAHCRRFLLNLSETVNDLVYTIVRHNTNTIIRSIIVNITYC